MKSFICKLLLGPDMRPIPYEDIGINHQWECLIKVWNSKSLGLTRLFRVILCAAPFGFPILYIADFLRKHDVKTNIIHSISDLYVFGRAGILSAMLYYNAFKSIWITVISIYFLADLILYVSAIVFLTDIYSRPISNHRTLLFFIINYCEVILAFSILHRQWGGYNIGFLCPVQALYFSAVTSTTLGYGDIIPITSWAQLRVVAQLAVSLLFVSVFISDALSRFGGMKRKR